LNSKHGNKKTKHCSSERVKICNVTQMSLHTLVTLESYPMYYQGYSYLIYVYCR